MLSYLYCKEQKIIFMLKVSKLTGIRKISISTFLPVHNILTFPNEVFFPKVHVTHSLLKPAKSPNDPTNNCNVVIQDVT